MSNKSYLLNTSVLTGDLQALKNTGGINGGKCAVVAEAVYRIPVSWLCCFKSVDSKLVKLSAGPIGLPNEILLPCTTVESAIENVKHSLPLLIELIGDEGLARECCVETAKKLATLPLPYLTLDPLEVFSLAPGQEEGLIAALSGNSSAISHLKSLSGYDDTVLPYPCRAIYEVGEYPDETRLDNAIALDSGILAAEHYTWFRQEASGETPEQERQKKTLVLSAKINSWTRLAALEFLLFLRRQWVIVTLLLLVALATCMSPRAP